MICLHGESDIHSASSGEATEPFIDLGVGYFCFEWLDCTVICDNLAPEPDMYFGPAAWGGGHGPHSGKRVCEGKPTRLGAYGQVAADECKWCMPDGTELDVEPPSWPRRLDVTVAAVALRHLHGVEFSDEATLVLALQGAVSGLQRKNLAETSAYGRLAVAEFFG